MEKSCVCGKHDKTKVSVVIPVYNGAKYIDRCLEFLFNQTFECFEIICVNDGSADNSSEVLKSYGERIVLVDKPVNEGSWKARETGFNTASGDYICLCDIDDTVEPNWIETLFNQIEQTKADISVCGFRRISSSEGKVLSEEMTQFGKSSYDIKDDNTILLSVNHSLWNKIYKKELLAELVKFDVDPSVSDDMILNVSIYPSIRRISFSPEVCYNYYVYGGSLVNAVTEKHYELLKDRLLDIKKLYADLNVSYEWQEYLHLTAFVIFSIFLPIKLGGNADNNLRHYEKKSKAYMNEHFPLWKRPRVFRMRNLLKHRTLSKLYISWVFSKMGLIVPFVRTYNFVLKTFKIEIKW